MQSNTIDEALGNKPPGEVLKEFLGGDVPLGPWNP